MKMGKVVETSFHHIKGKHRKSGREGMTVSRKFPCHVFSSEAHTNMILHLTEECKRGLKKEDVGTKP
jgi:hypothetical protein